MIVILQKNFRGYLVRKHVRARRKAGNMLLYYI